MFTPQGAKRSAICAKTSEQRLDELNRIRVKLGQGKFNPYAEVLKRRHPIIFYDGLLDFTDTKYGDKSYLIAELNKKKLDIDLAS
jgi:hypothetical protein